LHCVPPTSRQNGSAMPSSDSLLDISRPRSRDHPSAVAHAGANRKKVRGLFKLRGHLDHRTGGVHVDRRTCCVHEVSTRLQCKGSCSCPGFPHASAALHHQPLNPLST
jgi:hypothetical protein